MNRLCRIEIRISLISASILSLVLGSGGLQTARAGVPPASVTPVSQHPPGELSAGDREKRLVELREGLTRSVKGLEKHLAEPGAEPTIRDLPNAALAKLLLGQGPRDAEKLVSLAFAQQEMDEKSPDFGVLPWQIGHPEIHDANAIEFGTQAIGPMLLEYGTSLSPQFKKDLVPHLKAAFTAMNRRNFKTPAYTNIFLMRAVNMILCGEAVADAKAADEGYAQLDEWIAYTRSAGIHEFDSPTYYCTDLNSLLAGYIYASRPEERKKFKAILDYFWTDIAANYFIANGCLCGPNSRNYDFLNSWGGLNLFMYVEGFCDQSRVPHPDLEKVYVLLAGHEKAYHPPQSVYALANEPRRVVVSRWDLDDTRARYNFVTPDFAIGSASGGDYLAQDKLIGVELATANKMPVICVVPDAFDAPWGREKTLDGSGHSKPTHLPYRPVTVQEKGALLALLDLDLHAVSETRSIATNVLLPAKADALTVDGRRASADAPFSQPVESDSVVGVREGAAAVAIRIFYADGIAGQQPQSVLATDAIGVNAGAARLAVYHYRGEPRKFSDHGKVIDAGDRHVRVGLLILADHCATDAEFDALLRRAKETKIESAQKSDAWTVKANVGSTMLEASRDLGGKKTLYRRVDGHELETGQLTVNGQDLAAKIWGMLPPDKPPAAGQ